MIPLANMILLSSCLGSLAGRIRLSLLKPPINSIDQLNRNRVLFRNRNDTGRGGLDEEGPQNEALQKAAAPLAPWPFAEPSEKPFENNFAEASGMTPGLPRGLTPGVAENIYKCIKYINNI